MARACCRTRLYGMLCAAHGDHAVWMCLDCGTLLGHTQAPAVLAPLQ
ncbi:MAG TPA: hypothetical protein VM286_03685 [Candidatus Thermoplasmatota archaeon]|nr:hypothetical protein [Candidatus Thermoplasmatota archaeon]